MRPARYHRLATIRDLDGPTASAAVVLNKASSLVLSKSTLHLTFSRCTINNVAVAGCHLAKSHAIGRSGTTLLRASPSYVHHQRQPNLTGNVRRTSSFLCNVQCR